MRNVARALVALTLLGGCEKSSRPAPDPSGPATAVSAPAPASPQAATIARGSNGFGFELWGRIGKRPGNLAVSPASISVALAMTWPGAKGETAAQIGKTMHFAGEPAANARAWGDVSRALASPDRPLKLRIANRLFGEKTYAFEKPFLDLTRDAFAAPLERVDFKGAPDAQRVHVNEWVEEQTEKRIANLLPPASIDSDTRLVLVNAIYFLADWASPFDKASTRDAPFEVSASTKKDVPTMHATRSMPHARTDGVTVVELAYAGQSASMFVVVPEKKDGLEDVERTLTTAKLDAWTKAVQPAQVALSLPRFEIATPSLELAKELGALGMPLAFDRDKADFTAMANPPAKTDRLFVSKVFHKAFVKVDEKGTEAAAATAVVMAKGGGMPPKAIDVVVDHPFLFFIVDKASGLVLFMGRVDDPSVRT